MGKKKPKKYSAQFKFTVVLEALKGEKMEGEIARAYGVHPVTPPAPAA
jgi:transposase-like protein